VQFLAFVGSATAFLVGTRFDTAPNKTGVFYPLAWIATGLALLAIVSTVLVLAPLFVKWSFRVSAERVITIIDREVGREVPSPSEGELYRKLALNYEPKKQQNEIVLARVRWVYFVAIAAGSVQLVLWTVLVWRG
jgi:hypothetical protein